AGRVAAACQDETTRHWLTGLPDPFDEDTALAYVEHARASTASGSEVYWAVADVSTDALAGALTLMAAGAPDTREVGYWTHPDARGRGVMAEALRLAVRHARIDPQDGGLGLRRLVLRAAADNVASQRVAEQAGFVRTGSGRQAQRLGDGRYTDMVGYDLLCAEIAGP
ncbi:MAG TPA: GNAT family N-acetyltransferase, partial [Candidatus Lustribacter sp.]|nr:GNAT family N-acetyltransferase [Candidatus Lustribacter sp.]